MKPIRGIVWALCALSLALSPSEATTPAGRAAAAFLEAFNTGSQAALKTFVADRVLLKQRTADQFAAMLMQEFEKCGGLDAATIKSTDASTAVLKAFAKKDRQPYAFTFQVEPAAPFRIVSLGVELGHPDDTPDSTVAEPAIRSGMTDAEIGVAFDDHVQRLTGSDSFSGAVLLAKGDKPFLRKAYGLASRRFDVPNRVDTRFNLGSINKIFTAVAIGQLASQGKLSYDDPISRHLPDYPKPAGDRITIRQLVSHRSGLGDIFTDEFDRSSKTLFQRPRDFFTLFMNEPLLFDPGSSRRYSNAGYMVLGAIVEAASGMSYFDYVRKNLYAPAGMTDTDAYEADLPVPNLAEGYTREPRGPGGQPTVRSNEFEKLFKGSPAGGGYSTLDDLLKFAGALRRHTLLDPRMTALVLAEGEQPPAGGMDGGANAGLPAVGWAGGAPGTNASLEIAGDSTVIVLANCDPPAAERLGRLALKMIRAQ